MKILNFEAKVCERIRRQLDAYVNKQLSDEDLSDVTQHLEICPRCSQAHAELKRVKDSLRQAVEQDSAPASLRARIQSDLRTAARPNPLRSYWVLAAAAMVLISLSGYLVLNWKSRQQIDRLNLQVAAVLGVGLDDHIHCTSGNWYRNRQFTDEQVTASLGPKYGDMASLIKSNLPGNTQFVVGHKCQVNGREFIHFILRRDTQTASVIVTLKKDESYPGELPAMRLPTGIHLHEAKLKDYAVSGFEMPSHLIYFISDLSADDNREIARAMASPVKDFLTKQS